ncbi:ABC transporter permease [Microvirga sp. ACRRW]|uniref:ABC transporter permease n=1 Tax=Microvirga sp. ACRRW TaxID=2918205 RepID=UPI001EF471FE|nr:ABC transporter permease [Microvirga sp. ACRRW]MCG7393412.1 ABC transporter permease [Microvirga sp. ACRRW]
MLGYVVTRTLSAVPVMAVVATIVFLLLHLTPGDPATIIAGEQATAAEIERIRTTLGLDQPLLKQFVTWLLNILSGDLGHSIYSGKPVTELIVQRLEPTVSLALLTLSIAIVIAVPTGVIAAWKEGTWVDWTLMFLAILFFSMPIFITGYILIYNFSVQWRLLPVQGFRSISDGIGPFLSHMILPAISLGMVYASLLARMSRSAMLEVLHQDYIRTARAKGLGTGKVLFLHALKNAAVPIITTIGIGLILLISGVVVVESVFAIPGIGRLTVDAILRRDYPIIQGVILFFSFVYVIINLLIDLTYRLVDPRIKY